MTEPKLSVIIINLNEEARLPRLLDDLAAQTWRDFEIVHVDSNSDDGTLDVSEAARPRFGAYRIVAMTARGVSLGRNVGARHARGERLLFLDADTRLSPGFLETAMGELDARRLDAGVVWMSAEGLGLPYRVGFANGSSRPGSPTRTARRPARSTASARASLSFWPAWVRRNTRS